MSQSDGIGKAPSGGNFSATQDVQLRIIHTILEVVGEIEDREDGYILEMIQAMLADMIYEGDINDPMTYVRRYLSTSIEEEEMPGFMVEVMRRVEIMG